MKNKISHSAINTYTTCGRKYFYHYVKRLRSKAIHGALLFGSAIDQALNSMLEHKDLEKAKEEFDKVFKFQFINNFPTQLQHATNIVYSLKDFDIDLLYKEDIDFYEKTKLELGEIIEGSNIAEELKTLTDLKQKKGFEAFTHNQKRLYNLINWLSMRRKGHIMLKSYHKKILPRIKKVLAVQKKATLKNAEGDELVYIIDLIVQWDDGKTYLMDHKTSAMEYAPDSAMKSQQLVLYYHAEKEEYKLDGVGFIVLYKNIHKNKVKICSKCGFDGSGARFKTCSNEVQADDTKVVCTVRCNGEWKETINPECFIDPIINAVPATIENLVLETFDEANAGIKKEAFGPNLNACGGENFRCQYYNKCYFGKDDELMVLPEKKTDDKV